MARRAGKAANRRARQRNAQRSTPRPAPRPAPSATVGPAETGTEAVVEPRPTPPVAQTVTATGSTLTLRERAEYHYVERDLRNIGILTLVMAAMHGIAWFALSALGLT